MQIEITLPRNIYRQGEIIVEIFSEANATVPGAYCRAQERMLNKTFESRPGACLVHILV